MLTLGDIIEGYRLVNEWESEEEKQRLPRLTVEDSLHQYFELHQLARHVAPDSWQVFHQERIAYWVERHKRLRRAAGVMLHQDNCGTIN
ncbi:MAG: hypothetical protein ACOYZ7_03720 [Chloroflexota bacterium]